jgi:hypothetical protein
VNKSEDETSDFQLCDTIEWNKDWICIHGISYAGYLAFDFYIDKGRGKM